MTLHGHFEGAPMDRPISPVFSPAENFPPLDAAHSPLVSTDSEKMSAAIETISFKIFSWLSTSPPKKKYRPHHSRGNSAPPFIFPLDKINREEVPQEPLTPPAKKTRPGSEDLATTPISETPATEFFLTVPALHLENKNPPTVEEMLRENGYINLAGKINKHQAYPWSEFRKYPSPELIEQLVDLYELLELKIDKLTKTQQEEVLRFALEIANAKHLNQKRILGELIALTDKQPQKAAAALIPKNIPVSIGIIHQGITEELEGINTRLLNFQKAHSRAGIQHKEIATRNQLPIELAKILVSETGRINVGIIGNLLEVFLKNTNKPINYEINIAYALRLLQLSPALRENLSGIPKPNSPEEYANVVIRTTLKLPNNIPITCVDATKTALSALLSHLRQGSDGSCFATPLAIELLSSHLENCVEDFTSLINSGKLTRKVKNKMTDFPFILRMGKKNLDNKISLTPEGLILREKKDLAPCGKPRG